MTPRERALLFATEADSHIYERDIDRLTKMFAGAELDATDRLRQAALAVIAYEWGDPAKHGKGPLTPENQTIWRVLETLVRGEEQKEKA